MSRVVRATWAGLEVSLLDEPGLWPANGGSREGGGLSKWRLVLGDRILELCRIVIQTLLKGAQTPS